MGSQRKLARIVSEGGVSYGDRPRADRDPAISDRVWFIEYPGKKRKRCKSYDEALEKMRDYNYGDGAPAWGAQ